VFTTSKGPRQRRFAKRAEPNGNLWVRVAIIISGLIRSSYSSECITDLTSTAQRRDPVGGCRNAVNTYLYKRAYNDALYSGWTPAVVPDALMQPWTALTQVAPLSRHTCTAYGTGLSLRLTPPAPGTTGLVAESSRIKIKSGAATRHRWRARRRALRWDARPAQARRRRYGLADQSRSPRQADQCSTEPSSPLEIGQLATATSRAAVRAVASAISIRRPWTRHPLPRFWRLRGRREGIRNAGNRAAHRPSAVCDVAQPH
jgi:hypothetical protein